MNVLIVHLAERHLRLAGQNPAATPTIRTYRPFSRKAFETPYAGRVRIADEVLIVHLAERHLRPFSPSSFGTHLIVLIVHLAERHLRLLLHGISLLRGLVLIVHLAERHLRPGENGPALCPPPLNIVLIVHLAERHLRRKND